MDLSVAHRVLSLLSLVAFAVACGDPSGTDAAQEESDYTVTPTGGSSELLVTVPAGVTLDANTKILAQREGAPAIEVTPGTARALSAGSYCLYTSVANAGRAPYAFSSMAQCNVPVSNGKKTTVKFGAVALELTPGVRVLGLDPADGFVTYGGSEPVVKPLALPKLLPHPRGTYGYNFGPDALKVTVAEDQIATESLDKPAHSRLARLLPPASRAFPDPEQGMKGFSVVVGSWHSRPITRVDFPLVVRASSSATLQSSNVNSVDLELAPEGQPAKDLQFGRIDVDDVAVTMPDGSVQRVSGRFTVTRSYWGTLCQDCVTKHGVDAPPGEYQVKVTYAHPADGSTVSYDETVTVP